MSVDTDRELLESVLALDDLDDARREAFSDMLKKLEGPLFGKRSERKPLTEKQRAYARATLAGEHYEPPVEYENLVSNGKVSRVSKVELLVRDKPLRPPGR